MFEKDAPRSVALEHALSDGPGGVRVWSERAQLTLRDAPARPSAQLSASTLEGPALASFRELVRSRNAYSVRLPSELGEPGSAAVVASVPACALAAAAFAERLAVQLDTAGHVVSLSYTLGGGAPGGGARSAAECAELAEKVRAPRGVGARARAPPPDARAPRADARVPRAPRTPPPRAVRAHPRTRPPTHPRPGCPAARRARACPAAPCSCPRA